MNPVRFAIGGLAALLSSTSVYAADLALKPVEPEAPVVTPYDWTGPYLGLHAGYGWGSEKDDQSHLFPGTTPGAPDQPGDNFDINGFIGGAHLGYNYQINQFVIGAEADVDFADIKGSQRFSYEGGDVTGKIRLKSDFQGSARLRAGYAIDNLLLYVTGGVALANADLKVYGVSDSNTHIGWTAGGGMEYAFTPNWIGRAEVRYSDFSKKSYQTPDGKVKAGWDQTTANLGVSYKF